MTNRDSSNIAFPPHSPTTSRISPGTASSPPRKPPSEGGDSNLSDEQNFLVFTLGEQKNPKWNKKGATQQVEIDRRDCSTILIPAQTAHKWHKFDTNGTNGTQDTNLDTRGTNGTNLDTNKQTAQNFYVRNT